jgi:hypothetical protein
MRSAAILVAFVTLAGCEHLPEADATCPPGMEDTWQAQVLFGRNINASLGVRDKDWKAFVAAEIVPRFPSGFTVTDASGVWRGSDGAIVHEPSKVLTVLAPAGAETRTRLDAIAAAYKDRFRQEAVGIVIAPACVSF